MRSRFVSFIAIDGEVAVAQTRAETLTGVIKALGIDVPRSAYRAGDTLVDRATGDFLGFFIDDADVFSR